MSGPVFDLVGHEHAVQHTPSCSKGTAVCECGATIRMEHGRTVGEWHTCLACTPQFYREPVDPPPPGWSVAETSVPVSEQVGPESVGPFPAARRTGNEHSETSMVPAACTADLSEAQRQLFADGWGLVSTWAGGWAEMDSPGGVRMWVDAGGEKRFGAPSCSTMRTGLGGGVRSAPTVLRASTWRAGGCRGWTVGSPVVITVFEDGEAWLREHLPLIGTDRVAAVRPFTDLDLDGLTGYEDTEDLADTRATEDNVDGARREMRGLAAHLKALQLLCEQVGRTLFVGGVTSPFALTDPGNWDVEVADAYFQLVMLGEVIYG